MRRYLTLVLFILCAGQIIRPQTVPITITDKGFILLAVTVSDSIEGTFLLDTGAGLEVVSGKFLQRIGFAAKQVGIKTVFRHNAERVDLPVYQIPSLSIGGFRIEQTQVGLFQSLDEFGIDGLISLHAFENQPFTIDFEKSELRFESQAALKKARLKGDLIPFKLHRHLDWGVDLFIPLCLNDSVVVEAEFDTGSPSDTFLLHPYYARKAGINLDGPAVKKENYTNAFGQQKTVISAQISRVSICGIDSTSKSQFPVSIKEELIYDALVGAAFFKDRRVTIDLASKQLTVW